MIPQLLPPEGIHREFRSVDQRGQRPGTIPDLQLVKGERQLFRKELHLRISNNSMNRESVLRMLYIMIRLSLRRSTRFDNKKNGLGIIDLI